ncbi:MAG: UbiA family prenyltransferase [Thaumarchaeota archaeon]|nr:UbiA family prenyltransferase [Nitrososphaerota archaeon]
MQHKPDAREDVYFVLTSFAHVIIAVLFGFLLNPVHFPTVLVFTFAITSKAFALFVGENERFFVHLRWASVPLAALSLVILLFLPPIDAVLGAAVMVLYLNYPRLIKAREKSPLDIAFHGLRYALLFWLGFNGALTIVSATGVLVVFLFGVTGELLVGLRNQGKWTTTAWRLGTTSTVRITNILTFVLMVLASALFSQEVNFPLFIAGIAVPIPLLVGVVLALFIMRPISHKRSVQAPLAVRRREVLVIALVALVLVSTPLFTRVDLVKTLPHPNYTITVGMQTFVTGENPWEVQWIVFNYHDPRNFYYVLLHTDGTLELASYVNGTAHTYMKTVQTGLSPFVWHQYQITVVDGQLTVSIDGKQYLTFAVEDPGGEVMISEFFPHQSFWVERVTELQVSTAT